MKVYKLFLVIIIIAAFSWGVWYCISAYNEQRSEKKGLLVYEQQAFQYEVEKAGDE